jgi:orotate phosphoribosyltransferase
VEAVGHPQIRGETLLDIPGMVAKLKAGGYYQEGGHFLLTSQKHSAAYIQARVALMDVAVAESFAGAMAEELERRKCRLVAASTVGGILLATKAAQLTRLPLLIGRQIAREVSWTNVADLPEGAFQNVVLVDDVYTTGATILPSLASLHELGVTPTAVGVAVDRSSDGPVLRIGEQTVEIFSLLSVDLDEWDETSCELCQTTQPLVNLSNPEEDYLSVVLAMPERADMVMDGYKAVYDLQGDEEQSTSLEALRPWVPSLLAGLPKWRVGEDSGLVQFIRGVTAHTENVVHRRALIELLGHLIALANIRVESRPLGCAAVIGNAAHITRFFPSESPLRFSPKAEASIPALASWHRFIPYFDALLETDNVFLFDHGGSLVGIKHLARLTEAHQSRGTQLLREVTEAADAVALLVRRERRAVYVYRDGTLSNIAELSEKTGVWEFSTPGPILDHIEHELPGISPALQTVLEVCREMVTRGFGGLFVVGDRPPALRHEPPKVTVARQPLRFVGTREAAEIAKLDGAVFVSRSGELEAATVIIRNADPDAAAPTGSRFPRQPGGARSQAAHLTSRECPDAAVVLVSQNGIIEVHVRGRSWPVARAITGVLG